jgi:hypothetical protein
MKFLGGHWRVSFPEQSQDCCYSSHKRNHLDLKKAPTHFKIHFTKREEKEKKEAK